MKRPVRWYWQHRWPAVAITAVILVTIALYLLRAHTGTRFDLAILIGIVAEIICMVIVLILGNWGHWNERTTGLLFFALGDATLYGVFFLPGRLGWMAPYPELAQAFLRANFIIGPPLLILSYGDWMWIRFCAWRHRRTRSKGATWMYISAGAIALVLIIVLLIILL